jgi:hypothetical protein
MIPAGVYLKARSHVTADLSVPLVCAGASNRHKTVKNEIDWGFYRPFRRKARI